MQNSAQSLDCSLEIAQTPPLRGVALILLSGILYGAFGYLGVKILGAPMKLNSMLFWRFVVASASMLVACFAVRPALPRTVRPWVMDFGIGALLYGGCSTLYFMATDHIGTGLAMVIFFCYPAMVILFSRVFDRVALTKISIASLALVSIGFALMGGLIGGHEDFQFQWTGAALAGLSALCYAAYVYLSKRELNAAHPFITTLNLCLGSTALFYVLALFDGGLQVPDQPSTWIHIILLGLICTSIPIILLLEGLKTVSAGKAALLTILEPIITVGVGAALLGERVESIQVLGIIIILFGATAAQFSKE